MMIKPRCCPSGWYRGLSPAVPAIDAGVRHENLYAEGQWNISHITFRDPMLLMFVQVASYGSLVCPWIISIGSWPNQHEQA
jgi:hypothetical protein